MTTAQPNLSAHQPEVENNRIQNNERVTRSSSQMINEIDEDPEDDEFIVPILPVSLAVVCCLFNFVIPGFGTMLAACCSPCCANKEEMTTRRRYASCLAVFGIGILQLIMTACFMIGWIWSAIWGLSLVGTAVDFSVKEDGSSSWREPFRSGRRRPRSNFIYPMRAPSDVDRDSPPPPYMMFPTPPPEYTSPSQSRTQSPDQEDSTELNIPAEAETMTEQFNKPLVTCALCESPFAATDRRYLCRHCTGIVCVKCFTKTLFINGKRKYTICDSCYDKATQREPENG